jgi:hypothetical protein
MLTPAQEGHSKPLERHGSLLWLRLALLGQRLFPLFVRLDGALPGVHPPAMVRNQRGPLRPASGTILDAFLEDLASQQGRRS